MWGTTNYNTCRMPSAKWSSIAGGANSSFPARFAWRAKPEGEPKEFVGSHVFWGQFSTCFGADPEWLAHGSAKLCSAAQSAAEDCLLLQELMHYLQPSDEDFWQFLLSRLWAFNRQQFWLTLRFCSRCDSAIGPSVIWHSCASWDILDEAFLWPGKSFSFWFVAWSYYCVRCNVATLWLLWGTLFSQL